MTGRAMGYKHFPMAAGGALCSNSATPRRLEDYVLAWRNRIVGRQCHDEISANDNATVVGRVLELSGARGDALGLGDCVLRCAFFFSVAAGARGRVESDLAVDAIRAGCVAG